MILDGIHHELIGIAAEGHLCACGTTTSHYTVHIYQAITGDDEAALTRALEQKEAARLRRNANARARTAARRELAA